MALTRTAGPTLWFSNSTGQSSYTITGAITATSGNSIFIAFDICIDPVTDTVTSITLGGVAPTGTISVASTGNKTTAFICKWVGHTLSGSQSLIVNISAASAFGISGFSLEYSGSSPPDVDVSNTASGSGPTQQVTLSGTTAHAALITTINSQFADPTVGSGLAFTLVALQNEFVAHQGGYMDDIGSGGTALIDWAGSDLGWATAAATIKEGGGGGGSVTITGQSATYSQGTVSVTNSSVAPFVRSDPLAPTLASKALGPFGLAGFALRPYPLAQQSSALSGGLTATYSQGTFTTSNSGSVTLTGQTATYSQGTMTPTGAVIPVRGAPLPPLLASTAFGPLGLGGFALKSYPLAMQSSAVTLTGLTATYSQGTVTPASSDSVTLTGLTATYSAGTLSPSGSGSAALTGQTATFSQGTLTVTATTNVTLSGQTVTYSQGTLTATTVGASLTGQTATYSQGTVTPTKNGETIVVNLVGQTARYQQGVMIGTGGIPVLGTSHAIVGFMANVGSLMVH